MLRRSYAMHPCVTHTTVIAPDLPGYPGPMARATASWLSGPEPVGDGDYPGHRLGLPETGSRSLARFGRRVLAILIDWLMCYGLAALAMSFGVIGQAWLSTAVLLVWFVLGVLSV